MNNSQKLYLKRKAEQLNSIINVTDPKITKDQKIASIHAVCEDMILLNLENSPDITSVVNQFFNEDKKKAEQIVSIVQKINSVWNERFELCKNFNTGLQDMLKQIGIGKGFDFKVEEGKKEEELNEPTKFEEVKKDTSEIEKELDEKIKNKQ